MKNNPSALALQEAKALKVQIPVGQEHATLLNDMFESIGWENGTLRQNDSMVNHVAEPLSYQPTAYVPTPVFGRVEGLSYNGSLSNGTMNVEHHDTIVNRKYCEVGLRDETLPKGNNHQDDSNDVANHSTMLSQRSSASEANSRHDSVTIRDDAGNAYVNDQTAISKKRTNQLEPPNSQSIISGAAVGVLSDPNRDDFDDPFSPLCHNGTDTQCTFTCSDASNKSRKDKDAGCIMNIQPDSSDGETIIHAQVNCSGLGLTADKSTRELVQASSHQFIRGGPSTDSTCMQMTQEPTFDYFSQVSHRVGLANLYFPKTVASHQALCCHN